MTATIMPPEMLEHFNVCAHQSILLYVSSHLCSQPEYVAPLVAAITHPDGPDASGKVFVLGAGYISEIRWERSRGVVFKTDNSFTPSAVGIISSVSHFFPDIRLWCR
jgi:multifunctional beta-oxidation protein